MLNMKHVTFSKGDDTIGYLVTPCGCKPLDKGTTVGPANLSWFDNDYVSRLGGAESLRSVTRRYAGWNKKVIIV